VTGRVWPGATSGTDLKVVVIRRREKWGDVEQKKEKDVCRSKIVRYDVTGAPRTEEQKERMKI